ncbi:MAG TPA: hypothetical protein VE575_15180 [Acidimicrobiales bacterium]|nr:hypothetical protein [Acidimicrobiales bacterium]
MQVPTSRRRAALAAGAAGAGLGLAFATGLGPAPSLLGAAGADDGGNDASSTTVPTAGAVDDGTADAADGVVEAGEAGTVTVRRAGAGVELVSAVPTAGWAVEVEDSSGDEVEVDFRRGTERVQVDVEVEDGALRERVRLRDDADGTDVRLENGTVVRAEDDDRHGDDRDRDDDHDRDDNHDRDDDRDRDDDD